MVHKTLTGAVISRTVQPEYSITFYIAIHIFFFVCAERKICNLNLFKKRI